MGPKPDRSERGRSIEQERLGTRSEDLPNYGHDVTSVRDRGADDGVEGTEVAHQRTHNVEDGS